MISEGSENEKQQTDSIERELQHVESYGECIIPIVDEYQQDIAHALVNNSNLKYRVNQIIIMNKRLLFDWVYIFFFMIPSSIIAFVVYSTHNVNTSIIVLLILLYLLMTMTISLRWIAIVIKLTPPTFFCGALNAIIFSFVDPSFLFTAFSYFAITRFSGSFAVGMILALSWWFIGAAPTTTLRYWQSFTALPLP